MNAKTMMTTPIPRGPRKRWRELDEFFANILPTMNRYPAYDLQHSSRQHDVSREAWPIPKKGSITDPRRLAELARDYAKKYYPPLAEQCVFSSSDSKAKIFRKEVT